MLKSIGFRAGFRTLWLNFLMVLPVLADVFVQILFDPEFGALIPQELYPLYTLAVVTVNAIMRVKTTTPVGVSPTQKSVPK